MKSMTAARATALGLILVTALTLTFTFPGEKGIISAHHLHQELTTLQEQNTALRKENFALSQQACLLRENMAYIEHVIIKEMNLVKPGDIIVQFRNKKN